MLRAKSTIFRRGCGGFGALKQHPPGAFVRRVEEPVQCLVLCQIELPQFKCALLAGENPADEHDLDHVDKLELLVHQLLDTGLESGQLLLIPPDPAAFFPGGELRRDARSELGGRRPCGLRGSMI